MQENIEKKISNENSEKKNNKEIKETITRYKEFYKIVNDT